jgi:hypothetical protein
MGASWLLICWVAPRLAARNQGFAEGVTLSRVLEPEPLISRTRREDSREGGHLIWFPIPRCSCSSCLGPGSEPPGELCAKPFAWATDEDSELRSATCGREPF